MWLLKNSERLPWKPDLVYLSLIFAGNRHISTVVSELPLSFTPLLHPPGRVLLPAFRFALWMFCLVAWVKQLVAL